MTLCLDLGTKPKSLEIKTRGFGEDDVYLGDHVIPMRSFLAAACHVLTSRDLRDNDPRLQFVKCVRSMKVVKGHLLITNGKEHDTKRLDSDLPPVIRNEMSGVGDDIVRMLGYEISMTDFLIATHYVLTNSNLRKNDPRPQFVECVRSMEAKDGRFTTTGVQLDTKQRLRVSVTRVRKN